MEYEYVAASHPFMQEAYKEACRSGCGSRQIGAVIVKEGIIIAHGHNGRDRKSEQCPRVEQNLPSGIGYEMCPHCVEENHVEADAIRNARLEGVDTAGGEIYIFGHWWACEPCWGKIRAAGIKKIYLVEGAAEIFQERGVLTSKKWYQLSELYKRMQSQNINLFIFDWSGVISDDRKPVYETTARVLAQYGKPVLPFHEALRDATMTPLSYYRKHGISEDADILTALFRQYFNEAVQRGNAPTLYADAGSVFERLTKNGKEITVLSSHPTEFVKREASGYGINHLITHIRGGSHNKEEDLQNILAYLKTPHEQALYCGDTIYDIRAAKQTGIQSAGIASGYHSKEQLASENPDFLFDTLSELSRAFL